MKSESLVRMAKSRASAASLIAGLMKAGGVPGAETETRILTRHLQREWNRAVEEALKELAEQLEEAKKALPVARHEEDLQDFAVAVLASLYLVSQQASPSTGVILSSARRLLALGAKNAGFGPLDFSDRRVFRLLTLASTDLDFWAGQRLPRLEEGLVPLLKAFFRGEQGIREVLDSFEKALSDPDGKLANLLSDAWTYRTINTGAVVAAVIVDEESLTYVNNPPGGPDSRTTPFCRNIHGLAVNASDLYDRLISYHETVASRNPAEVEKVFPFLTHAQQTSLDPLEARREGIIYPPFHHLCRTVLVRTTDLQG